MKILAHSNAPWAPSGYGQQVAVNAPRLKALGHEVAVSAFFGLHGSMMNWEGHRIYPAGYHPYGNDVLLAHARHHFGGDLRAGLILTLIDAWVLDPAQLRQANVACWTPVDHDPAPPKVVEVLSKSGAAPIAMSRFGERALRASGLEPLYVPHSIDTNLFRPGDKRAARAELGLPEDAFVVGMVAANKGTPPRKGWPQAIEAFAKFAAKHEDALLYMHTEPHGLVQGANLPQILQANGVKPDQVRFGDPYSALLGAPVERMRQLYCSFDVFLNPAYGEGFGIPILEAQACGVPVIVTDWTAMPEVGAVGWHIGGQRMWTDQGSYWLVPDVERIAWALEDAHGRAAGLAERAREHALTYDADRVATEHWEPALAEITERLGIGRPMRLRVPPELVAA